MDIYTAKLYTSLFEIEQLSAKVLGELSLESLFAQIPTERQPHEDKGCRMCPFSAKIRICRVLENSLCAGIECDIWKEKDGE